jgi:hypothetical protein
VEHIDSHAPETIAYWHRADSSFIGRGSRDIYGGLKMLRFDISERSS